MSSRWYPIYQKGNPQLRIFLPNFWMKLVKNTYETQNKPNRVDFIVSMGMGKYDIKNYLEKIYNVRPAEIRTFIRMGSTKRVGPEQYVVKEDDYKVAIITLPDSEKFEFPEIFPKDKMDKQFADEKKALADAKNVYTKLSDIQKTKPGLPGWFS